MVTVVVCVRVSWLMKIAGFDSTSATLWMIVARSASTAMIWKAMVRGPQALSISPMERATAINNRTPPAAGVAKKALTTALPRLIIASVALLEFALPKMPLARSGPTIPRTSGKMVRTTSATPASATISASCLNSAAVTATPATRKIVGIPMLKIRVRIEPSSASGENASPPRPRLPKYTLAIEALVGTSNCTLDSGIESPKRGMPRTVKLLLIQDRNFARPVSRLVGFATGRSPPSLANCT